MWSCSHVVINQLVEIADIAVTCIEARLSKLVLNFEVPGKRTGIIDCLSSTKRLYMYNI